MSAATPRSSWQRRGLALPLLIFAMLAGLFWYALHGGDPSRLPSAMVGKPVPSFTLPPIEGLNGEGFAASDLAKGEPTIVNVWASWCVPCHEEHPLLDRKSTRLNSSHQIISYAVFCLKKKK